MFASEEATVPHIPDLGTLAFPPQLVKRSSQKHPEHFAGHASCEALNMLGATQLTLTCVALATLGKKATA